VALWNGRDPILKERAFGLTGSQGNHGEDVKEYWWYLDAIPSHAWNRWRYHYPQAAYPYQDLIDQNARRDRHEPEYELIDTGVFDADRYWIVEVHYAKADPDDLLMKISVTNAGPAADTLHALGYTVRSRARRIPRTGSTTTWSTGRPRSTPSAPGPSARSGTSSRSSRPDRRVAAAAAAGRDNGERNGGCPVRRRVRPGDGGAVG
jgi:hypothetical protein